MESGIVGSAPALRIRMYRHGLGDCLLLRFARADGNGTFNLLIDCGLIMVAAKAQETMVSVAEDIAASCRDANGKPRLDVVVLTHEHWDHVSGFSKNQAQAVFAGFQVGEVWYAWTEDPQDELGERLRRERAAKVKALAAAVQAMSATPALAARAGKLTALLGFFGLDSATADEGIGRTRAAFDYLRSRPEVKIRYCAPEDAPITLSGVPNFRVYVLGPPRNEAMLKRSSPSKREREVYDFAVDSLLAQRLDTAFLRMANSAGQPMDDCPFDPTLRRADAKSGGRTPPALSRLMNKTWSDFGAEWRRIEHDWTQAAEALALNLDSHTNNTCLVLAFERVDNGQVMLFPADAQVGNWLSWQELHWIVKGASGETRIRAPELLERTVFYKVGHHGSHNATLRALGLERMRSEDLVAFIPVVREQAVKNRWMGMPFEPLVQRLSEKTHGRLLMSDQPKPKDCAIHGLHEEARSRFAFDVEEHPLWFEYSVR